MRKMTSTERAALFDFAKKHNLHYVEGWANQSRTIQNPDAYVFHLKSVTEQAALWAFMVNLNKACPKGVAPLSASVASGGTGKRYHESWSLSRCATAHVIFNLMAPEQLVSRIASPEDQKNHVVTVGANAQIDDVDRAAYKAGHSTIATLLLNQAGYDGAWQNGAHGTGQGKKPHEMKDPNATPDLADSGPTISSLVNHFEVITPAGTVAHLSRDGEFTETMQTAVATSVKLHYDMATTLGPDFYKNVSAAPMGLLGPVTEVAFQYKEQTLLRRYDKAINLFQLNKMIQDGIIYDKDQISYIFVCRYQFDKPKGYNEDEEHCKANVLLTYWDTVSADTEIKNDNQEIEKLKIEPLIRMNDAIHLPTLLRHFPDFIPLYTNLIADLEIILRDGISVAPSNDSLHYLKGYPRNVSDIDGLVPFQFKHKVCEEALMLHAELMKLLRKHFKLKKTPLSQAMYNRFLRQTPGGMSLTAQLPGEYTMAADFVSADGIPGWSPIYNDQNEIAEQGLRNELVEYLVSTLKAKLHWGKTVLLDGKFPVPEYLDRFEPGLTEYVKSIKAWCDFYDVDIAQYPAFNEYMITLLGEQFDLPYTEQVSKEFQAQEIAEEKTNERTILQELHDKLHDAKSFLEKSILGNSEHADAHENAKTFIANLDLAKASIQAELRPSTPKTPTLEGGCFFNCKSKTEVTKAAGYQPPTP